MSSSHLGFAASTHLKCGKIVLEMLAMVAMKNRIFITHRLSTRFCNRKTIFERIFKFDKNQSSTISIRLKIRFTGISTLNWHEMATDWQDVIVFDISGDVFLLNAERCQKCGCAQVSRKRKFSHTDSDNKMISHNTVFIINNTKCRNWDESFQTR